MENPSQIIWEALNLHFGDSAEFASSFNQRKAWRKNYYVLYFGVKNIWLHAQHKKNQYYVEIYTFEHREVYEALLQHQDEIEKFVGCSLEWYETKGKSQNIRLYKTDYSEEHLEDDMTDIVRWTQEKALVLKQVLYKWAL